ncbi:MAG TPA: methyltransferase domain-containing protein [Planctomycetaceae bacterium]|nr:methyltransferase domain-containing protein [Planctomycetaceae bacterium]
MNHMTPDKPQQDPTQILDDFRASALSQLLVASAEAFDIGSLLEESPKSYESICDQLGLAPRSATVLLTGLRSLGLIDLNADQLVGLTEYGREKLSPKSPFNLRGYIGLGAFSVDTQKMIACLKNDAPAGDVSFVYHDDDGPSALDDPETSATLTRAMAARARNIAPFVAEALDLSSCRHLVDVGGGHGIYAFELLKRFPDLQATIIDRQPPLTVAEEYAANEGLSHRIEFAFGDIHHYCLDRPADVVLMANILHDYDTSDASRLVAHYAGQLTQGGKLVVLDAFLDSVPPGAPPISPGPRPVAAYSAMLFSICEGRCYRLDEYQTMLIAAGLQLDDHVRSVPAHGQLLCGTLPFPS